MTGRPVLAAIRNNGLPRKERSYSSPSELVSITTTTLGKVKQNILANLTGGSISALLSVLFAPVYLRYLGVELYGVIGFFSSIQAFLSLLDGGISPTLNRETARLSALPGRFQELRDLSRTLEVLCWGSALLACLIAFLVAPVVARHWLRSDTFEPQTISNALMLMSISFAFQWAISFYTGGLLGLQAQKTLNTVTVVFAVVRSFGAWTILALISPTIVAFLLWQLAIAVLNCLVLAILFWRNLPAGIRKPSFDIQLLTQVWRYAAGMTGIGILSLILTQTDKVILSKLLSLEQFGYYSLAFTLAGVGIGLIVSSVQTAYFPQFSTLVAQRRFIELNEAYHRACQVMSFFLIPAVTVLSFFSYQVLTVWTGNEVLAEKTFILLTLIAVGTGLLGLMHLPFYVQLAFGITRFAFWQNIVAIVVLIPLMIWSTLRFGAVGGACCWVVLNLGYTLIGLQYMHRLILKGELSKWYLIDVGPPVICSVVINCLAYVFFISVLPTGMPRLVTLTFIGTVFLITTAATLGSLPAMRGLFLKTFFGTGGSVR